jgi:hypothetical protein
MGYEIIYDKQFIKLERKDKPTVFIPMILAGSSNWYDTIYDSLGRRRERRERSWSSFDFVCGGARYDTMEGMLQRQQEYRDEKAIQDEESIALHGKYNDKRFGYWSSLSIGGSTHSTTFGQYQGIVKTGCKNALTIEELAAEGHFLTLKTASYSKEKLEAAGVKPIYLTPETTEEFFSMLEKFLAKTEAIDVACHLSLSITKDGMKRLKRNTRPQRKKVEHLVEVKQWWTIDIAELGAFVKFTRSGTRYSRYNSGGLKFADKEKAEKKLKYVQDKMSYAKYTISLKEHNTPTKIWETKFELIKA